MANAENKTFNFELVSPERKLISEPAVMVTIPGGEGDFGVLANHSPLLSTIRAGVIEVVGENDNEPRRLFVAGGFADVTPENCTVLAEYAINVADLDQAKVEKELADLKEDLAMAEGDQDKARVQRKIDLANAKLTAVTGELQL